MNNPGIDVAIWERLREKWAELQSAGHKVKVSFHLIADPEDENKILAIDVVQTVVQTVDEEVYTETVQRNAEEAYGPLGIAGLPMERLVEIYKEKMHQLHREAKAHEAKVIVMMSTNSPTSGETKGYIENPDLSIKNTFPVNYRHYYILNALRGKMVKLVGDDWHTVKTVYQPFCLELYFEY